MKTETWNKILIGLVCALVAIAICLIVIPRVGSGSTLGASETAPTYIASSATRMNDTYMYGDLETKGTTYPVGAVSAKSTLSVAGISTMATTSVTALCVYNGTNWVKITFSGATPSYATSTTCL